MVTVEDINFKKSYMVRKKTMNVLKEKYKEKIDFIDNAIDKAAEKGLLYVKIRIDVKKSEEEDIDSLIKLYKEYGGFDVTITKKGCFLEDGEFGYIYFITFYWL